MATPPGQSTPSQARFADRLLAQAVASWEGLSLNPTDDRQANAQARSGDGDFEQRIIARAEALPNATSLKAGLVDVRFSIGMVIVAGLLLACIAGIGAARAALSAPNDQPVNFFWAMAVILGPQTILLIVWIALLLLAGRSGSAVIAVGTFGGWIVRLAQRMTARMHHGSAHTAAAAASACVHLRGALGKWMLSAISNGLWVSFNVGCAAALIALLSTERYTFTWATTILSKQQYIPITRAVAVLPRALGFNTPTDQQIELAEKSSNDELNAVKRKALVDARQAWSSLLAGSLVVYGLGPRLLLLGYCLGRRRWAVTRYRLDLDEPAFARLRPELMPESAKTGVIDADDSDPHRGQTTPRLHSHQSKRPVGPPAIVGVELDMRADQALWPPPLHAVRWQDMGFVDARDDQKRVIAQLLESPTEPETVVVVCALTTTPDRGIGAFLAEIQQAMTRPMVVLLTGGEKLRGRSGNDQFNHRVEDWHAVARNAGVGAHRILELDLDHLTQTSAAKLSTLVRSSVDSQAAAPHRRIEQAFALIIAFAESHHNANAASIEQAQARLHQNILELYRDKSQSWRATLGLPSNLGDVSGSLSKLAPAIKTGAERLVHVLPPRLQLSPKWLAAGAAAGALGCVVAAALIAPPAVAALPVWTAVGAAIAQFARPVSSANNSGAALPHDNLADAVRAAALFSIVLELQGRDERTITRILDRTLPDDDSTQLQDSHVVHTWLDSLRHQLDVALAQEPRQ